MKNCRKGAMMMLVSAVLAAGCAEPRETTQVAAATGGAIGAGLGAILGNQTGSTGGGLAIGALAGAATGAAIGNAIDGQQQALQSQDEAIERQQAMMTAQRAEIEELRRISQDSISYRSPAGRASFRPRDGGTTSTPRRPVPAPVGRGTIVEADIPTVAATSSVSGSSAAPRGAAPVAAPQVAAAPVAATPVIVDRGAVSAAAALSSEECTRASAEAARAERAAESADKLFHLRRALRLCPDHPNFHNELGEVYVALQRTQDAEYEFKEALRLDSGHVAARENLARIVR